MNHKYLESDLKVGELDARWDNTSSPGLKITPSPLPLNKSSAQIPRFCHDPMTLPLLLLTSHLPFLPFCTSVVCESPLPLYYHYWLFMLFLLRIWFLTNGHGIYLLFKTLISRIVVGALPMSCTAYRVSSAGTCWLPCDHLCTRRLPGQELPEGRD